MRVISDPRAGERPTSGEAPPPLDPDHSTRGEDLVTLAVSVWLLGGLFLDGYAHVYVIDTETEDFFTPWHGVIYAGLAALGAWIAFVGYRRRRPGPLVDWFPRSYRLALVGLGLFALGGIGDGIWHTIYGIEIGVDALLSPTHLVLFTGGLLLAWTPVRSSAARGDASPWLAVGAATVVTAVIVFFLQYLWLIPYPFYAQQFFDPVTNAGTNQIQVFFGGAITSVGALLGPLLLVAKRWRLPFGAATLVWGVTAALEGLAFSQRLVAVLVVAAAGLAFDVVLAAGRRSRYGLRAAAATGPVVLFAGYLVWTAIDESLRWPPEIWGGLCATVGLVGLGLVLLQEQQPLGDPPPQASVGGPRPQH